MKITSVKKVGKKDVYDLSVADVEHYILENGVVTHNTGQMYSANTVFIIGRQQEKDDSGVAGYNFVLNVEKSRKVREKKKFIINVMFDEGINKWSGLLDLALEGKFVVKPKNGWYAKCDPETGEVDGKSYRESQTNTKDFWQPILDNPKFNEWIMKNYQVSASEMLVSEEDIDSELENQVVDFEEKIDLT